MPVIVGYCDPIDTIRTFYIGMLLLALERSDNDLKIYNMVKSPIIEDFLSNRKFDNTHCRKRQQPIQQIIKIYPKNDKEFICNENNEYYAISEDETIVEIIDKNGQQLKLNRIVQWAEKYNKLLIETESKNDKFLFDYVAFNEEGLRYAKEMSEKFAFRIADNIFMAYFCDYMSFLLSLQQKIMLCMKQEKTIYKGYFTYQANIIGYATYKLK